MAKWRLTVRAGSKVDHDSFDDLEEAIAVMRGRAMDIRAAGPAREVSMLRDFAPGDQVRARLQLSGPGWRRKAVAGVDVRGDGTFMPYSGRIRREELDPTDHESPFDLVREVLEGGADER